MIVAFPKAFSFRKEVSDNAVPTKEQWAALIKEAADAGFTAGAIVVRKHEKDLKNPYLWQIILAINETPDEDMKLIRLRDNYQTQVHDYKDFVLVHKSLL